MSKQLALQISSENMQYSICCYELVIKMWKIEIESLLCTKYKDSFLELYDKSIGDIFMTLVQGKIIKTQ